MNVGRDSPVLTHRFNRLRNCVSETERDVTMRSRLPKGSYPTHLIERRTVSTRTGPAVELVFQVVQGEYAGEEIRTRVWLASQIAMARDLSCTGGITVVDVGYRVNHRGEKFWGVTDFRPLRDQTVAAAVAGLPAYGAGTTGTMKQGEQAFWLVSEEECDYIADSVAADAIEDRIICLGDELFRQVVLGIERPPARSQSESPVADDDPLGDCIFCLDAEDFAEEHEWALVWDAELPEVVEPVRWNDVHGADALGSPWHGGHGNKRVSVCEYTNDIRTYQAAHGGSVCNYRGLAWSRRLLIGVAVGADLSDSLRVAQRTAAALASLGVPPEQIAIQNSFNESLTLLIPSGCVGAVPQSGFELVMGHFGQLIADLACMDRAELIGSNGEVRYPRNQTRHQPIDGRLYRPLAFMPAPNTRDAGSGLFAVLLTLPEFLGMNAGELAETASAPRHTAMPSWQASPIDLLGDLWNHAVDAERSRTSRLGHHMAGNQWIHADTWDFFHYGGKEDGLEVRVIRVAMNLLSFNCPLPLLEALMTPPAMKSGLGSHDITRLIDWAVNKHRENHPHADKDEGDNDEYDR